MSRAPRAAMLEIDGAYGEGGGQIVRSALTLGGVTGRALRLKNIRAGRSTPGLAAQHLTAVRAVAQICGGDLDGDFLGSQSLGFRPAGPPRPDDYAFDVGEARPGGSAGAVSLVLQAILPALAVAIGPSHVMIRGGTHMAWSPSFDYCRDVWLPALEQMNIRAGLSLGAWGWFPVGQGSVEARIEGQKPDGRPHPLRRTERGALRSVFGRAVAANLPAHIAQRMADRTRSLLASRGVACRVVPERVTAACAGAGIFLTAEYEVGRAGFMALGKRGKPAEQVADEAATALLDHHVSGAAVDCHLADQLIVPAALADGETQLHVARSTRHLETMAWLVERFGLGRVSIESGPGETAIVTVTPNAALTVAQSSQE